MFDGVLNTPLKVASSVNLSHIALKCTCIDDTPVRYLFLIFTISTVIKILVYVLVIVNFRVFNSLIKS